MKIPSTHAHLVCEHAQHYSHACHHARKPCTTTYRRNNGGSWVLQNSNVGGYNSKGFVEVLAASQSPAGSRWFQGTADAVRQYLWLFEDAERSGVEDFLILSGAR